MRRDRGTPVGTATSIGHPSAAASASCGAVGPLPLPPRTVGFQPIARSDVFIRSRTSGTRIGFRSVIRADAYLRFVRAIVSDETRRRYSVTHSAEQ